MAWTDTFITVDLARSLVDDTDPKAEPKLVLDSLVLFSRQHGIDTDSLWKVRLLNTRGRLVAIFSPWDKVEFSMYERDKDDRFYLDPNDEGKAAAYTVTLPRRKPLPAWWTPLDPPENLESI